MERGFKLLGEEYRKQPEHGKGAVQGPVCARPLRYRSESQPQRELDMAFRAVQRAGDLAEVPVPAQGLGVLQVVVGSLEHRRIREIERFRTELHSDSFREPEVLEDGQIQCSCRGTGLGLQAQIAAREGRRSTHVLDVEQWTTDAA